MNIHIKVSLIGHDALTQDCYVYARPVVIVDPVIFDVYVIMTSFLCQIRCLIFFNILSHITYYRTLTAGGKVVVRDE